MFPCQLCFSTHKEYDKDMDPICPGCHVIVRSTDYFCYNCGKNLKPKPPSTSIDQQILMYVGSILLPPMGFIWGYKYLKQKETTSKVVGFICMLLTIVVIIVAVQATIGLINTVNNQINSQTQNLLGE